MGGRERERGNERGREGVRGEEGREGSRGERERERESINLIKKWIHVVSH